jgi:lysozyme
MLEGQVGDVDKLSLSEYMASQVTDTADKDAERIAESNMMTTFLSKKVFSEIELISQNLVFEVDELDFTLSDLLGNIKRSNIQSAGGLTSNISSPAIQSSDSNAAAAATSVPQMPAMPSGFGALQSAVQTLSSGGSGRTSGIGSQRSFSGQATSGISQPDGGYIARSTAPQMPSATPVAASGMTSDGQMNTQQNTGLGGGEVQMPSGDDASVMAMIKKHEGVRDTPYKDSVGLWTVGVGHMIGPTLPPEWNKKFSPQEIDQLFAKDFAEHKAAAQRIPGFEKLNSSGQAAVIDLTFNMGPAWFRKFPAASAALAKGDVQTFANEMQNSAWFKQVGNRGPTIVGMIRGGGDTTQQAQQVPGTPGTGPQLSQAGATTEAADQAQMRGVGQQISSLAGPTPGPISQTSPTTTPQAGEVPINIRLQNLQA